MGNISSADQKTARVCRLSGIQGKLIEQKLITLRGLEKSLNISIEDASKAAADIDFWEAMILTTKCVQVSCDIVIGILATVDETGIAGQGISAVYDVSKLVADAFTRQFDAKEGFKYAAGIHADAIIEVAKDRGPKWAKVAGYVKVLASSGDDLYDFFAKRTRNESSGVRGAKRAAQGLLLRVRSQIASLDSALADCAE